MNWRVLAAAGVMIVGVVVIVQILRRPDGVDSTLIDGDSIVMLGDSITAEGDWSAMFPDIAIVNHGHSGFTTAQLVPVVRQIAAARPRVLFVLTGTNDIRDGESPSWTAAHLTEMLDIMATQAHNSLVVLQTVLPREDHVPEVRAVNVEIRELAAARGLDLLDLHSEFDDGHGALRPDETYDGIHLSEAGYERWADLLRPVVDPAD